MSIRFFKISIWSSRFHLSKSIFYSKFPIFYLVLIVVMGDESLFNIVQSYTSSFLYFIYSCWEYFCFLSFVSLNNNLFDKFCIASNLKNNIWEICVFFFHLVYIANTNAEYVVLRFYNILAYTVILAFSKYICDLILVKLVTILNISW